MIIWHNLDMTQEFVGTPKMINVLLKQYGS